MSLHRRSGLIRFARYVGIRTASIAISLLIAVFLLVFIAHLGGKLDEIVFEEVKTQVRNQLINPQYAQLVRRSCEVKCSAILPPGYTTLEMEKCINNCIDEHTIEEAKIQLKAMGIDLDQPTWVRMFTHYRRVLAFEFGTSSRIHSYHTRSKEVKIIIAEAIPQTVLLFTTANLIIFLLQIVIGLFLSRRYGTIADKIGISLAPLSSMPGWFYGMILLLLLGIWYPIFPSGGMISENPPENPLLRALDVMYHMVLPILAWLIANLPIGAYSYRTFFLIFSTEEYVEYARARGVPESTLLRRYILRPTLPPIITTFVLMVIGSWMGAIITERIFRWPGLGTVMALAIGGGVFIDAPVIVGIVTIYSYLLAISVLVLDIVYGIVDPRVRVGE
ncbi:MAG: ABC transporter permease [Desulfurococcaceae archaeon]